MDQTSSLSLPSSAPFLPPELTDYILDYCHDDKPTLSAGSLVSRSFNQSCRYHIFSSNIDLSNATPRRTSHSSGGRWSGEMSPTASYVNNFEHNALVSDHVPAAEEEVKATTAINPASSAGAFARIVLAPTSSLAPFLQELSLVLRPVSLSAWATIVQGKEGSQSAWLDELLTLLPATSTTEPKQNPFRLRTLRIFRHGVGLSEFAMTALHQNFSSVTTLALFETTLQPRSMKVDIGWSPDAGEGGGNGVPESNERGSPWGGGRPGQTFDLNEAVDAEGITTIRLPRGVRRLRLDLPGPALEAFMRWLLAHTPDENGAQDNNALRGGVPDVPSISTLHIFRVMEDGATMLRAYLRACKNTLEDLMLFLYQRTTDRDDFDFSEHSALRTLFLASNGAKPMQVLYDILSTTGLSSLQRVLLQIPPWQLGAEDDSWEALDKYLAETNTGMEVSVVSDGRGTVYEENVVTLKTRFPLSVESMKDKLTVVKSRDQVVATYLDEVYGKMRTF
ncbi:hypothetical protein D9757_008015 [Collybiopsis confluens]|uniref:Uncharacterized protein n=1 Tax=Collybiopsis confluens TaxID=2823264 RepID=A0A8H5H692_9AGAR|nr:hypothetical protein D9757_008015 [Collybiopsis confluens]